MEAVVLEELLMFRENAWQGNKVVDILRRAHEVIITLGRMGQLTG